MLKKIPLFTLIFLSLWSCQTKPDRIVARSFYYWKTTFALTAQEQTALQQAGVRKLYVRYFDVDWNQKNQEARPVSAIKFKTSFQNLPEIIPTVYITNRTLQNLPENEISILGDKILGKIRQINRKGKLDQMQEIQLDCDWTESTSKKYFTLVKHLKNKLKPDKITLSVTIRLHQVKYARRTGIPPADRGMLMFYNMGDLKNLQSENSIYNPSDAEKYLVNFREYPLPLDVALPTFSWAVIFRKTKAIGLLNNVHKKDFSDTSAYRVLSKNQLKVKKLLFRPPHYIYPGDVLKFEESDPETTLQAARQIEPLLNTDTLSVALYHWDLQNLDHYEKDDLEAIYTVFK